VKSGQTRRGKTARQQPDIQPLGAGLEWLEHMIARYQGFNCGAEPIGNPNREQSPILTHHINKI
jgi:hypothetical protein